MMWPLGLMRPQIAPACPPMPTVQSNAVSSGCGASASITSFISTGTCSGNAMRPQYHAPQSGGNFMRACLAVMFAVLSTGCSGVRFIIDAVPSSDKLTETVVIEDKGAGGNSKIAQIDLTGLIADADR